MIEEICDLKKKKKKNQSVHYKFKNLLYLYIKKKLEDHILNF